MFILSTNIYWILRMCQAVFWVLWIELWTTPSTPNSYFHGAYQWGERQFSIDHQSVRFGSYKCCDDKAGKGRDDRLAWGAAVAGGGQRWHPRRWCFRTELNKVRHTVPRDNHSRQRSRKALRREYVMLREHSWCVWRMARRPEWQEMTFPLNGYLCHLQGN